MNQIVHLIIFSGRENIINWVILPNLTMIFLPLNSSIIQDLPTSCPAPLQESTLSVTHCCEILQKIYDNHNKNHVTKYLQGSDRKLITLLHRHRVGAFSWVCRHIECEYEVTKHTAFKDLYSFSCE